MPGLAGKSYPEKCKAIGLETLECRRWEQDMIQTYKILGGIGNIRSDQFFEKVCDRERARTRLAAGYNNLKVKRARTEIRRNAFSLRIVNSWNNLPDSVKESRTVGAFKVAIKRFIENGGRPGYK
jgi:hypothetical protein